MSFCTFSTESIKENFVKLENSFIESFVPSANPDAIRVYLWGLYKCNNPTASDNTLDSFSHALGLSPEDIISSFYYWQELGLVQVLNVEHFEIKYLPVSNGSMHLKKYNKDKYKSFNMSMQDIYGNRMISTHEYNELYYTMESLHIDEDAMLLIANYCIKKKSTSVSVNYIVATAKNWAYSGVHTLDDARARISDLEKSGSDVKLVLSAIGTKRSATDEEYFNFITWIRDLGISLDVIIHIAKHVGKVPGAWNKLNAYIDKCYALKLNSTKEIDDYLASEQMLYDTAKSVCKNLGVRYERLDTVVDTYITNWFALGFDTETLNKIANYCFTSTIRTLQGMNGVVNNLFKNGLITIDAIQSHLKELTKNDEQIANVLSALGLVRGVNANDRMLLKTWVYDWNLSKDVIDYACTKCAGQYLPLQYLNRVLATYHTHGVKTVEDAKKVELPTATAPVINAKKPKSREYSKDELDSLFSNLDEVELWVTLETKP